MPRQTQPFEQDFLLITETEMRVRQATQYAQLHMALVPNPHDDIWDWDPSSSAGQELVDKYLDEESTTVWESMLERL
jgi:hypothetical protein